MPAGARKLALGSPPTLSALTASLYLRALASLDSALCCTDASSSCSEASWLDRAAEPCRGQADEGCEHGRAAGSMDVELEIHSGASYHVVLQMEHAAVCACMLCVLACCACLHAVARQPLRAA
jgi:hypothetical protein